MTANLLAQAETAKLLSDEQLGQKMQYPPGDVPLFVYASEANRRKTLRAGSAVPPPTTTVQQELLAMLGSQHQAVQPQAAPRPQGPPQGGVGSPPQQLPPQGITAAPAQQAPRPTDLNQGPAQMASGAPQGYAQGGIIRGFADGPYRTTPRIDFSAPRAPFKTPRVAFDPRDPDRDAALLEAALLAEKGQRKRTPEQPPNVQGYPDTARELRASQEANPLVYDDPAQFGSKDGIAVSMPDLTSRPKGQLSAEDRVATHIPLSKEVTRGENSNPNPDGKGSADWSNVNWEQTGIKAHYNAKRGLDPTPPATTAKSKVEGPKYQEYAEAKRFTEMPNAAKMQQMEYERLKATESDPYAKFADILSEREGKLEGQGDKDKWMALAEAGFAMAGGKSQYALSNIGEGASVGFKSLKDSKASRQAREDKNLALDMQLTGLNQQHQNKLRDIATEYAKGQTSTYQYNRKMEMAREQMERAGVDAKNKHIQSTAAFDQSERQFDVKEEGKKLDRNLKRTVALQTLAQGDKRLALSERKLDMPTDALRTIQGAMDMPDGTPEEVKKKNMVLSLLNRKGGKDLKSASTAWRQAIQAEEKNNQRPKGQKGWADFAKKFAANDPNNASFASLFAGNALALEGPGTGSSIGRPKLKMQQTPTTTQ